VNLILVSAHYCRSGIVTQTYNNTNEIDLRGKLMQLVAILGVLVAVNLGIVYVGSEAVNESEPVAEGVVEVETVDNTEMPQPIVEPEMEDAGEAQAQ
jgi:hypothetical protein